MAHCLRQHLESTLNYFEKNGNELAQYKLCQFLFSLLLVKATGTDRLTI